MKIGYEAKRVFHNKTGLGNYSRDLVRMLASYFPDNNYILYNPKKSKQTLFVTNEKSIAEKNPISNLHKKLPNYWRQKAIVKDLVADKIDLFHGLSGEIPSGLQKANIKSIVTIHDLIFIRYPDLYSFWDKHIHYFKFKKAAQKADIVIAISEQTKQDIIAFLGIQPEKIKVIYQGCQEVFKQDFSKNEKNKVAEKFQLPEKFILNVGTIEARKNAFSIVKAIKDIDTYLVLIGKQTDYAKEIIAYINEHNMQHKVAFLKNVSSEELAIIYQLATVFVYPSIFEGFGIPIIEALFSKTPVITTNSGVFPEAGGPNSIYVAPDNIADLQNAIQNLLDNEDLRNEIAEKGFQFVQKFQDKHIATQLMETYNAVYNGK